MVANTSLQRSRSTVCLIIQPSCVYYCLSQSASTELRGWDSSCMPCSSRSLRHLQPSRPPALQIFGFAASFTGEYLHINNCWGPLVKLPGATDKSCVEGGEEEGSKTKRGRSGNICICMACRMQMHFSVGTIRGCSSFTACGS